MFKCIFCFERIEKGKMMKIGFVVGILLALILLVVILVFVMKGDK